MRQFNNPMLTEASLNIALKEQGHVDTKRGSGRTTAIAFEIIATALSNPYVPIVIIDHHNSLGTNKMLKGLISKLITKTNLTNMKLRDGSHYSYLEFTDEMK